MMVIRYANQKKRLIILLPAFQVFNNNIGFHLALDRPHHIFQLGKVVCVLTINPVGAKLKLKIMWQRFYLVH